MRAAPSVARPLRSGAGAATEVWHRSARLAEARGVSAAANADSGRAVAADVQSLTEAARAAMCDAEILARPLRPEGEIDKKRKTPGGG